MKRIAIVAHGLGNGGAEHVAVNLANYFSANHEVLLVAVYSGKRDYEIDPRVKICVIPGNQRNRIARMAGRNLAVLKAVRSFGAERVISFITNEALLTHITGIPMVYSLRVAPTEADENVVDAIVRKYEYSTSKAIVFQTRDAFEYYSTRIQSRGVVIPNPVRCDVLPVWNKNDHNNTFVSFGRLNSQKNLTMLIRAFVKFHKTYPKYRLDIYGRGEQEEELRKLIIRLGAEDYVRIKGFLSDIHQILAKSFAYVSSSDYEGLSNSMLEALAVGIPCICTDCPPGGPREYIVDGVSGLLTEVADPDAMVSAMEKLVSGEADLASLSDEAVKVRDRIDYQRVCGQWSDVIA